MVSAAAFTPGVGIPPFSRALPNTPSRLLFCRRHPKLMSNTTISIPPSSPSLDDHPERPAKESSQQATSLQKGQLVTITGPCGTWPGQILHVEQPGDLPSAQGAREMEKLRAILAAWDIVELALIRQQYNGQSVTFIASRDTAGAWRDLERRPLTITPMPSFAPSHSSHSARKES